MYAIFVLDFRVLNWETKQEDVLLAVSATAADS
jgi:hypothetical protein